MLTLTSQVMACHYERRPNSGSVKIEVFVESVALRAELVKKRDTQTKDTYVTILLDWSAQGENISIKLPSLTISR